MGSVHVLNLEKHFALLAEQPIERKDLAVGNRVDAIVNVRRVWVQHHDIDVSVVTNDGNDSSGVSECRNAVAVVK